jgi:hypothetical protein
MIGFAVRKVEPAGGATERLFGRRRACGVRHIR